MNKIGKGNKIIFYEINYKAIKHVYFRIKKGVIVVSAPVNIAKAHILDFLNKKFDYFYQKINLSKKANTLTIWGKGIDINIIDCKKFSYKLTKDSLTIFSPYDFDSSFKLVLITECKKEYLKNKENINVKIAALGLNELPILYKYYTSRYGQIDLKKKIIYINTFLATQNPEHFWATIMHEYVHLIHKKHDQNFYYLVNHVWPSYRQLKKGLKSIVISKYFELENKG